MKYPIHQFIQQVLHDAGLDIRAWCYERSLYVEENGAVLLVNDDEFYDFLIAHKRALTGKCIANLSNLELYRHFNSLVYYTLVGANAIEGLQRYIDFKNQIGPIGIELKESETEFILRFIHKSTGLILTDQMLKLEHAYIVNVLGQGGGTYTSWQGRKHKGGRLVENRLVFQRTELQFPFLKSHNFMSQYLIKARAPYYNQLMTESGHFSHLLIDEILMGLLRHEYHIISLAKQLQMNERAIQRHLHDEGTSYKRLLKDVQQMMIKVYLDLSISSEEIAFLTGFTTLRDFLKTFRAWFGKGFAAYTEERRNSKREFLS
ncbi:helix-turn-helix domain-containing protein [uncultured Veillonella sp.]|uniref:helix-turn-helix domain-containing protein n=1 Tax=uncultured Veillonella sp. TaxID=159268 RepID=UPI00261ABB52|nr:helix-turn-helix domain-containing protein [uncultured Veillonella sp.]